jgi:hypothetical protein
MWAIAAFGSALAYNSAALAHDHGHGNDHAQRLKGDYAFTGTASCLNSLPSSMSPGGFEPDFTARDNSRQFMTSFSAEGIRTFNGNGTGTVTGTTVSITEPPTPGHPGPYTCVGCFPPGASSQTFSFQFTYTVNNDGTWTTQMVPGTFTGTVLTGPRTGQTFTNTIPPLTGLIGKERGSLTVASVTPAIETIVFSNGDSIPRICHRSRVLVKMKNDRDD